MKVSLNVVKQFTDIDVSVSELVDKINRQLGGVDDVLQLGDRYKDALIVRVVSAEQHPNADRLSVCLVDDDGVREGVERDENGYVQVVCGAPNVHADMYAVWLPPASTVPASAGDDEPFVLGARELRGVMSQGMLAAGDELAVNDNHDGILEVTDADLPHHLGEYSLRAGLSFAHIFGLDDVIIDIENKMFTHRPDLFGQLGVAREIAGIQHKQFVEPEWYVQLPAFASASGIELTVHNDAPEKVPRFMTVALQDVTVAPSPLWLQCALVALGSKPINNVVDITNYAMLMTAQPVHAYDYDKLRGKALGVRTANTGERVTLLNHKTYELHADDLVIVDGEGPVGLAGVMGGGESEVSSDTKNIILEVATFDMYAVRKTAMRHGVFTDALTRYNKGQSPLQNDRITALLLQLLQEVTGAAQASDVTDSCHVSSDAYAAQTLSGELRVQPQFINERLGLVLPAESITTMLRSISMKCDVSESDNSLVITAPFWRTDIELPEDVVEEVGRLHGFENLPRELPRRSIQPAPQNVYRDTVAAVRQSLSQAGANEVLTYSFVHERVIAGVGQDVSLAYKLTNALSPDLQYYRLSVTPSLLDKVHMNIKAGHDEFALFEVGKAHSKKSIDKTSGLPAELLRIALTYAAKQSQKGAAYYRVKVLLEHVATSLGLQLEYKPLPDSSTLTVAAPFANARRARVIDTASGQVIGVIGEYTRSAQRAFKLPEYSAGFELLTEGILIAQQHVQPVYTPLSRYPSAERDVSFRVNADVAYQQIIEALTSVDSPEGVQRQVTPLAIYQPEDGDTKTVTVRVTLTSNDKTLTSDEVAQIVDELAAAVVAQVNATII